MFVGAGCGGDAVYGGSSGVRLEDLPGRLAELNCRFLFECCTAAQIMTAGMSIIGNFTDEPGCRAAYTDFLSSGTARIQDSIRQDRMQYSEGAAGACIAQINGMTCEQLNSQSPPECTVFTPRQKDGEVCETDTECISDVCEIGLGTQGTCVQPPKLGEPCSGSCEKGSACDSTTEEARRALFH